MPAINKTCWQAFSFFRIISYFCNQEEGRIARNLPPSTTYHQAKLQNMIKNNISLKATLGYCAVAIVLVMAIALVYSNTQSILSINQASREYIQKRNAADSAMTALLKKEQSNLKDLAEAMSGNASPNYLHEKLTHLNTGKDSIMAHPKTAKTHEVQNTTVEVIKTKKGFFRRLADAFKKEHAETLSVKKDSNHAIIDTITPVNVAEDVADVLAQIDKKEKAASKYKSQSVHKEMTELQMVNAQLALQSAKQLNDTHQKERDAMQKSINQAIAARQHLLVQIGLLAAIAIITTIILLWYIRRDVKKEQDYRENLEQANEEIQRILQQRERLLLTITHDIKAPAASISGFIDLIKEESKDIANECIQSHLNSIQSSATHLSRLVAALLDYHQLENGLMELHPSSFAPAQLVKQCADEMHIQAQQKSLTVNYEVQEPDEISSLYRADAFRIHQILNNLVSNAIKYTDCGSVSIMASIHKSPEMGNNSCQLILKVKDTGKGMTAEEKKRIFQAFTRLENAQGIEGTGLGLSITKELVSLLGGRIQLETAQGKGSTFTVFLPIEACAKEQEEKPSAERHPQTENHKILILDDDKLQITLLKEMLLRITSSDWQVFACSHIPEALTVLHNEQPSIMLMDIEMPEMNGLQLIKHINHHEMTVIAMTAHDESIKAKLLQAGFDDCLFKPFQMESLAKLLGMEKPGNSNTYKENSSVTAKRLRFQPLLTFAEGDKKAEAEILQTVRSELAGYCQGIEKELKESINTTLDSFNSSQNSQSIENIGKIAHKLFPIASMLQMQSVEAIKALSPEYIGKLDPTTIHQYLQETLEELRGILEEVSVP